MMTIIVGDRDFQMHCVLSCFHSEYFRNLLNGPFEEGSSNTHTLSDVSHETFTMFYNWVYTCTAINIRDKEDADLSWADIVNLYIFADYHLVHQLRNRAVELFFMHMVKEWVLDLQCTPRMYENITEV